MEIEKISQEEMLSSFRTRYSALLEENQRLSAKMKENEGVALKLLGAIEALSYYIEEEAPAAEASTEESTEETTAE